MVIYRECSMKCLMTMRSDLKKLKNPSKKHPGLKGSSFEKNRIFRENSYLDNQTISSRLSLIQMGIVPNNSIYYLYKAKGTPFFLG